MRTLRRPTVAHPLPVLGLLALAGLALPPARAIDAGGQANLMQQHTMMRNQSTGDGPDWIDREALRRKNGGKGLPGVPDQPRPTPREMLARDDVRALVKRERARLQPEYERRVRDDGKASADRWLREVAAELGRRAGEAAKAR